MKKDFICIWDLDKSKILNLFQSANYLKKLIGEGKIYHPLDGKTLAMIFEKSSTRTRVSFEVGMYQLGGKSLFLSNQDMQLGRGESIEDTARVLSRYVNGIMIRTTEHQRVERLARAATIPVINGLTNLLHPCQALSDYYTLWRMGKKLDKIKLAYIGDGNNVCHSLILGAAKLSISIWIATPEEYQPKERIIKKAKEGKIHLLRDPEEAVKQADVVYTDVWTSMGWEEEKEVRKKIFQPYQLNSTLLSKAKPDALVMHCLPAHRGEEITDEIIDGENSIIFEQAENRLHLQKAILLDLLK